LPTLKRLLAESLRHWRLQLAVLLLSIGSQAAMIAVPAVIGAMVDPVFIDGHTDTLPMLSIVVIALAVL